MRFLIFDSNVVYAKKVANLLRERVLEADVELAHNLSVLTHRLGGLAYDLVIADVDTTMDTELAIAELNRAAERMPVIIWSAIRNGEVMGTRILQRCNATQVLKKAFATEDIESALNKVVNSSISSSVRPAVG
jgi:DNA-binding NarL/FixJ family response regulator